MLAHVLNDVAVELLPPNGAPPGTPPAGSMLPEVQHGPESYIREAHVESTAGVLGEVVVGSRTLWCSRRGLIVIFWTALASASFAASIYIYARSWYILLRHGFEPCDMPVAKVLFIFLIVLDIYFFRDCLCRCIRKLVRGRTRGEEDQTVASRNASLLAWVCYFLAYQSLCSGASMLKETRTCSKTAPDLYNWASYLFPSGAMHFAVLHILAGCAGIGLLRALLHALPPPSEGADPSVITQLESVDALSSERQCSICLDGYREVRQAKVTPCCGNIFHGTCLGMWLQQHRSCPLCRADLQEAVSHLPV